MDNLEIQKAILRAAFDNGVTHFDLANNYGPVVGSAESNFGQIIKEDFVQYRDEVIISTKAGYYMWAFPKRRTNQQGSISSNRKITKYCSGKGTDIGSTGTCMGTT